MSSLTQTGTGHQPVHPQKMHRASIPSRELMWSSRSCLHEQGSDADPPLEDTEKCSITTHSLLKRRVSDRGQILGASFLLDDEDSPDILGLTDDVGARHGDLVHVLPIIRSELMWSSRSCLHEQGSDADPPLEDTEKCSITTHSLLKRRVSDRGQILGASFLLDDEDSPDILGLTDDVGARHGDLVHVLPII